MKSLKKVLLSTTVGLASVLAAGAVTPVLSATASAQDYTTGGLDGSVVSPDGQPIANASVSVISLRQGAVRTVRSDQNGSFRLTLLPAGPYRVAIVAEGFESSDTEATVIVGRLANYTVTMAPVGATETIVVTGQASQSLSFAQTTSGLNIDVAEITRQLPIGRDIQSLAGLAPTVVEGDPNFEQPAIGGSSAAENAFYVNGLNITNFDTYVGGATVPFDFYQTVEVKNGGYPAEFGRATGGVINAVTKSGSNEFTFGVHGNFELDALSDTSPDTYQYANTLDERSLSELTLEAGGPIIKDRLFFYGLYQLRDEETRDSSFIFADTRVSKSDDPFWGVKLDGYITDDHHLEFTYFDTSRENNIVSYTFDGDTRQTGGEAGRENELFGGESYVAKYTGSLTDWFTLSAAYGVMKDRFSVLPSDPDTPYIQDARSGTAIRVGPQTSSDNDNNSTERKFYRIDGDVFFDLLGEHHVRFGYDNEKTTLNHLQTRTGGVSWRAFQVTSANTARYDRPVGTELIRANIFNAGGTVEGENKSYYIQDSWDVNDRLNLQLGLRNDHFIVENLAGEVPIDLNNNWGPRFGFNYDVYGDGMTRLYGSYGRYFIPPASNLSFRGADLYTFQFFELNSFDANTGAFTYGAPLTLSNSNIASLGAGNCPAGVIDNVADGCIVYGMGEVEPAISKTSLDLKATYEDEFVIGLESQINDDWTIGARGVYRSLGDVSEDVAIDHAILKYCEREGIADCGDIWYGDHQYVVLNPGRDIEVYTRDPLPGQTERSLISLSAGDIALPEAEREYVALELTADRAFDGVWSMNVSYVWSASTGNYEGTILSDNGQDDAGSTALYDHVGLADNQYGYLPNHRRHQLKIWGSYQFTDDLLLGANASVMSPRKYGCLGVHPTEPDAAAYGAFSRYCNAIGVRRGTAFETDWVYNLDLSARYTLPIETPGDVILRADVFNVFNASGVTTAQERGENATADLSPNYRKPLSYQAPRLVRLGFDWTF
ncbi:TonB-dependent receptor [Woodsholea maritima]|uniref:TonB-dependent receptor n=1 Tax=Woodsholea maritima TaxID=240237 RepID=UPI00036D12B9|nr:TonB-dependent receptor [Woodsholea maritima]